MQKSMGQQIGFPWQIENVSGALSGRVTGDYFLQGPNLFLCIFCGLSRLSVSSNLQNGGRRTGGGSMGTGAILMNSVRSK